MTGVRFVLALAWRVDKRRLLKSALLMLVGYLATPFLGLTLRGFTDHALAGGLGFATAYAAATAALLLFELMMVHFAHLTYFELGELCGAELDQELLRRTHGRADLSHVDDPVFADTLALVRQDTAQARPALEGVLHLGGLLLRAGLTTVILAFVNPWLALLPAAALPPVLIARKAQALINRAREGQAEQLRLTQHLVELATSAAAVKEVRLFGAERFLMRKQAASWAQGTRVLSRALLRAAALRGAGQLLFALAYGTAILLVVLQAQAGQAGVGDVVLVVTLAVQVSVQVAGVLGLMGTLQAATRTAERLAQLRADTVDSGQSSGLAVTTRLERGISLEGVSFRYPGAAQRTLESIDLEIPAGATVAVVGENGAGKTTLVKLLCGLYSPESGLIEVDGVDLRAFPADQWHGSVAMLFQDFARLQLSLRESVGIGRLSAVDDDEALLEALTQAQAEAVLQRVPKGLDGLLGRDYGDGAQLSGGQWQKVGLARALLRPRPLLLALDEPAAALDPEAEHALFDRLAAATRQARGATGAVTLFVSHRFSTVRMADLIVVLERGRIAEKGSHAELMARGGSYAELFDLQARAYS